MLIFKLLGFLFNSHNSNLSSSFIESNFLLHKIKQDDLLIFIIVIITYSDIPQMETQDSNHREAWLLMLRILLHLLSRPFPSIKST